MSEKTSTEKLANKGGTATGEESPTTARPLDFDDEPQEGAQSPAPTSKPKVSFQEEAPPPKPPRPMSPQAQAEMTLYEAFPDVDTKVVKAVLVASGGKVEPAFNALLSMSDPNFRAEPTPPPQPPRPTQARSQMEQDELYARQLAQHYQSAEGYGAYGSRSRGDPPLPRQRKETSLKPNELYDDKEHSFFEDDLPVIKESVRKGFIETQSKVTKWISDFKKKIDGEDEDDDLYDESSGPPRRQNFGPSQSEQMYGIRKSAEMGRRSADRERYDADPHVLSDDFTALELRDNEDTPQRRSNRPLANPDLFKPTPAAPQSGPVDEVEAVDRRSASNRQPSPSAGKTKKWQPLTSVAPHPEAEDNDPFSLGDSDDENEAKSKDIKAEDTERLKRAASVSQKGDAGSGNELRPAQRSGSMGTKDKEAEELLAGKT